MNAIRSFFLLVGLSPFVGCATAPSPDPILPHDTFTLESKVLGETRRINVYLPPSYASAADRRFPTLYMPDGGINEDFPHLTNTVDELIRNGAIREHLVVGIENTQRRRDLTGPTEVASDREIAPVVGGSAEFRGFVRDELMPAIRQRYRVDGEESIVGESLAGLFIVETYLLEPALFDSYIAMDPSLWWNGHALLASASARVAARPTNPETVYLTASGAEDIAESTAQLAQVLERDAKGLRLFYSPRATERHDTIYRASKHDALTRVLAPR